MRLVQGQMGGSWQITPRTLIEAVAAGGDEAKRAFDAMMDMTKVDVAAIEAAGAADGARWSLSRLGVKRRGGPCVIPQAGTATGVSQVVKSDLARSV